MGAASILARILLYVADHPQHKVIEILYYFQFLTHFYLTFSISILASLGCKV